MHNPTDLHHSIKESLRHGLQARIAKQGWKTSAVGLLSLDEQGNILADEVLASGPACIHLSPCTALKMALTEDTHTILVWMFHATPSESQDRIFREFLQTLLYGCIEFGIRLEVLSPLRGNP